MWRSIPRERALIRRSNKSSWLKSPKSAYFPISVGNCQSLRFQKRRRGGPIPMRIKGNREGLWISPFSSRLSSRPSLVSCLVGRRESQACELVRVRKSCGFSLLIVFFGALLMPKILITFVMSEGSKANLLSQGQKLKAKRKLGTFKEKELQSSLRKPRAFLSLLQS